MTDTPKKLTPEELAEITTDLDREVKNVDINNPTIGLVPHAEVVEKLLSHSAALEADKAALMRCIKDILVAEEGHQISTTVCGYTFLTRAEATLKRMEE